MTLATGDDYNNCIENVTFCQPQVSTLRSDFTQGIDKKSKSQYNNFVIEHMFLFKRNYSR